VRRPVLFHVGGRGVGRPDDRVHHFLIGVTRKSDRILREYRKLILNVKQKRWCVVLYRQSLILILVLLTLLAATSAYSQTDAAPDTPEEAAPDYLPDVVDVEIELLLEPGDSEEDRQKSMEARLEAAVRSDPNNVEAVVRLGILLQLMGRHEEAIAYLSHALSLAPDATSILVLMAESILTAGPIPEIPDLPAEERYIPDEIDVRALAVLQPGGSEEEQIRNLTESLGAAVRADPADFEARVTLAVGLQLLQRHADARVHLEAALAMAPDAVSLYSLLARSLSAADPGLKVYVNGRLAVLDVPPVLVQNRTLLPLRAVAEQLGAQVDWNDATATAAVTLGPNRVQVTRDSTLAIVNGRQVTLDVPAVVINGRTMLPLRFVAESLNKRVDYFPGDPGSAVITVRDK
jgi:cytochrome c-type biogenesis protein CcmH/NrfG